MRLTFLGAAREVTGSMLLVEGAGHTLLIDCGMYQGRRAESRRRNRELPAAALRADAVLLTHAHIDHSGSLPTLVRNGYQGAIYSTPATRDLCAIMLRDSARIQESDAEYLNRKYGDDPDHERVSPAYDEDDVIRTLERFVTFPYKHVFEVLPGMKVRFLDAGHILGSAQIVVDVGEGAQRRRLLVSGDLGRAGLPILRDPDPPPTDADAVVMESTYGNRMHGTVDSMRADLERVVRETVDRGGKIIVPAFALGRTQELLFVLHQLVRDGKLPRLPIFIDSPLAIDVTEVFRLHPECFDVATRKLLESEGDVFAFEGVQVTRTAEESIAINRVMGPAIIIAASGMCEAGRVLHHLRNYVGDPRNTILMIGFTAQHTLGRRLVERRAQVKIWGVERELRARVEVLGAFSAHADQAGLMAYAEHAAARAPLFLVHGEPEQQQPLQAKLVERGLVVGIPGRGDVVSIPHP